MDLLPSRLLHRRRCRIPCLLPFPFPCRYRTRRHSRVLRSAASLAAFPGRRANRAALSAPARREQRQAGRAMLAPLLVRPEVSPRVADPAGARASWAAFLVVLVWARCAPGFEVCSYPSARHVLAASAAGDRDRKSGVKGSSVTS